MGPDAGPSLAKTGPPPAGCCAQSQALPVPAPPLGSRVNAGLTAQLPPRPQGQDLPVPMPLCWLCRNFISRLEASIPKVLGGRVGR